MDLESPPGSPTRGSFSQSSSIATESEIAFLPPGRSKYVSEATPNAQEKDINPSRILPSQKDTLASSSSSRPLHDTSYEKSSSSTSVPSLSPITRNPPMLSLSSTFRIPASRSTSSIIPPASHLTKSSWTPSESTEYTFNSSLMIVLLVGAPISSHLPPKPPGPFPSLTTSPPHVASRPSSQSTSE
jgi:hypothetical protein